MPQLIYDINAGNNNSMGSYFYNLDSYVLDTSSMIGWIGLYNGQPENVALLYFLNDLPQGAIITNAYLKLYGQDIPTQIYTTISCIDVDNMTNIPDSYSYFLTLPRTSNQVEWLLEPTTYESPNLTSVIQEVVDRPGWASGNGVLIFHEYADIFESDTEARYEGPELYITYEDPAANLPITLTATLSAASDYVRLEWT